MHKENSWRGAKAAARCKKSGDGDSGSGGTALTIFTAHDSQLSDSFTACGAANEDEDCPAEAVGKDGADGDNDNDDAEAGVGGGGVSAAEEAIEARLSVEPNLAE